MDRDRGFNFKLLVPRLVSTGQVSAVRPREIVDNSGDFLKTSQQGYTKCFDKEHSMSFSNKSMVAPTKPTRQDIPNMKVVPPIGNAENNCSAGQLCSKLFDEVEKIKCWKVQTDSDTVQKERRLQENQKTIETQRKTIQELQFVNESLGIKLEEQISENEDLRNRTNATRNLCNILKDTFQRSTEKMHFFESEKEETHNLLLDNCENIQKLIVAFEGLRIQVEADQKEMQKVKDGLLQFEDLKEKYDQEYIMKEKEVEVLETKLKDKENELDKVLLDFSETQKQYKKLQETIDEKCELLKNSKTELDEVLQKLYTAEQRCKEAESNSETIALVLKQSKEEYETMIESRDLSLQELSRVKSQHAEKLEQIQTTIHEQQNLLALEIKRGNTFEDELRTNREELERSCTLLGEAMKQNADKEEQIRTLEAELDSKSKSIESMKAKIDLGEVRLKELTVEHSRATEEVKRLKEEAEVAFVNNDLLKLACEAAQKAQEDLKEESTVAEMKVQELEGQLFTEKEKNKQHTFLIDQLQKDITKHKVKYEELLSDFNELQTKKTTIQQQLDSGSSHVKAIEANMKLSEEKTLKLTREIQRLEEKNHCLREEASNIKIKIQEETDALQKKIEENCEQLNKEITEKDKRIKAMETKLVNLRKKVESKLKAHDEYQKENKVLKKQIAKEIAKSSQLEIQVDSLHQESQNLKTVKEENHQKLLKDLELKSAYAAELDNEVEKLKVTATEALKTKEETELKCQHKIADMVALMEKHKNQYDRMVDEKDAELDENKKKEMENIVHIKALELDLLKLKAENEQLKQQLKTEVTEKENFQNKMANMKKEKPSLKMSQTSEAGNKQPPSQTTNYNEEGKHAQDPKKSTPGRQVFEISKNKETPSNRNDGGTAVMKRVESDTKHFRSSSKETPKMKEALSGDQETRRSSKSMIGGTSKIKSYRMRTPPSAEKGTRWGKSIFELDSRSDSSDRSDLLTFASVTTSFSPPHCKLNMFKKIRSPVTHKSPGNSLKLAAMKRIRDAGWTAVTCCEKRKKTTEKIFA